MRLWLVGLSAMVMVTACDKVGMGSDGQDGPGMSGTSVGGGTTGGTSSDSLGGSGNLPPTSSGNPTTGAGTEGCAADETAADPWGDEDGCDGGLPTHSPWDVGSGGSCWAHLWHWNASCEEEPCLDYDCHSPSPCGPVTFGECDEPGGSDSGGDDDATTGGSELEVDDPAALECILEALRDHVPIKYTIIDCDWSGSSTTYEIVSNGLVITTLENAYGEYHDREQQISTFNDTFDFESCVGPGAANWEKRQCVEIAAGGPCPVGAVACPAE